MLKNFLTSLIALTFTLLLIEGVLYFLPVNEGLRTQPVNDDNPIARLEPNRTSTWSRFADFSMINTVRSNNYGFINDQDYDPNGKLPLLAVIGDSYVEAAMVPYAATMHGRLARELKDQWRVYSFAMSGAPLSQYLAYARYARDEFRPVKIIVVIVGNDFDESLLKYKASGGFHYFADDDQGILQLVRQDYSPSLLTRALRNSMLARYLVTNVQLQTLPAQLRSTATSNDFVGQTAANVSTQRTNDSLRAIDRFLELLPEYAGLPPKDITLLLDGIRPHLYDGEKLAGAEKSYFNTMRRHLSREASRLGFEFIDMQPRFIAHYKKYGKRFEYPKDGHWNAVGHEVVAREFSKKLRSGRE